MAIAVTSKNSASNPIVVESATRKVFNAGKHFVGMLELKFTQSAATGVSVAVSGITKWGTTVIPLQTRKDDGTWQDITWAVSASDSALLPIWLTPGIQQIVVDVTEDGTSGDTDALVIAFHVDDDSD